MGADASHTFRAVWPIIDSSVPGDQLAAEVVGDLPALASTARARLLAPGRFYVAPSRTIPGSGNVTANVLVYECPARPARRRVYHQ